MRWLIFKVISFLAVFMYLNGVLLPWAISNSSIPLWLDIVIITMILMMWLAFIDRIAQLLLNVLRKKDEVIE